MSGIRVKDADFPNFLYSDIMQKLGLADGMQISANFGGYGCSFLHSFADIDADIKTESHIFINN